MKTAYSKVSFYTLYEILSKIIARVFSWVIKKKFTEFSREKVRVFFGVCFSVQTLSLIYCRLYTNYIDLTF